MKKYFSNKKLLSVFLTLTILLLILMLGPAEALLLEFFVSDGIVYKGEPVEFKVSIKIEQGEILDIKNITLLLEGPEDLECAFLPNGTLIAPCPEIQITKTQDAPYQQGYGYGYGYGYNPQGFLQGLLEYKIILDSETIKPGQYQSKYIITTPRLRIQSPEQLVSVRSPKVIQGCSVRAKGGTAVLGEKTFENNNKLSFYVPSSSAAPGEGSFTAQEDKRISYSYQIQSAIQLDDNIRIFRVAGNLRFLGETYQENATIRLDEATSKIDIKGDTLKVENMNVGFMRC
jgi:hypothetical protein